MDSVTKRLVQCIIDGETDTAKEIIESGQVDLNACHATALHDCVYENNIVIAELLIANGCDINARECFGWTALYKCVAKYRLAIAELLIMNGCDMNIYGAHGSTALNECVFANRPEIA